MTTPAELLKIKPTPLNEMIKRHEIDARRKRSHSASDSTESPAKSHSATELTRE